VLAQDIGYRQTCAEPARLGHQELSGFPPREIESASARGILFDLQVYNGVNFLGGDLNDGMANQQRTAFDCQTSCDRNNFCNFWSWSAPEAAAKSRLGCWLKGSASSPYMAAPNGKNYGACPVPACRPLPARI
jgi:hypothetical protein